MDGIEWMDDFNEKKGVLQRHVGPLLDTLMECVEKGYLNPKTLSLNKTNALPVRERMLDGTLLLAYGNVRLFNQLCGETEQYEYVMLPFWATGKMNPGQSPLRTAT